jgi:hypothetical protein
MTLEFVSNLVGVAALAWILLVLLWLPTLLQI